MNHSLILVLAMCFDFLSLGHPLDELHFLSLGQPLDETFYLSVPGFQSCLGLKNVGTSTARCLPRSKPEACISASWTELARNPDKLSYCDDTRTGHTLPPFYLSIPGFQSCLGLKNMGTSTARCLPRYKPEACISASWTELARNEDELSYCDDTRIGHTLPPYYLSVPGFQSCLGSKNMGTSTAWCLPRSKPEACISESWTELARNLDELSYCGDEGDYSPAPVVMAMVEFAIGRISADDCEYHLIHGKRSVHDFESQVVAGMNYRFVVYVEPYVGPEMGDMCKKLRCEFTVFESLPGQEGIHIREEYCLYL